MGHGHALSAAYVLFAGIFLVPSIFAIRKGVITAGGRFVPVVSVQRRYAPVRFWLVVSVNIGAGLALLWLAWYAV
jgi:hypothetical protein